MPDEPLPTAYDPASLDPDIRLHWDHVARLIAPPDQEEQELYAPELPVAELIKLGTHIRSKHVLTDLLRWSGTIALFLKDASPEERDALCGFDPGQLRVMFAAGQKLRQLVATQEQQRLTESVARSGNVVAVERLVTQATQAQDQLWATLRNVAQGEPVLLSRIDQAYYTGKAPEGLAQGLRGLARLGRSMLEQAGSRPSRRLIRAQVDAAYFERQEALAEQVQASGLAESGARVEPVSQVTQAQLDAQDGVCLVLMRSLLDLFDAAHELQPRIPRLLPNSTRRFFRRGQTRKTEPVPPTP